MMMKNMIPFSKMAFFSFDYETRRRVPIPMAMEVMIKVRKFVGQLIRHAARVVGKPSGELGGVELS